MPMKKLLTLYLIILAAAASIAVIHADEPDQDHAAADQAHARSGRDVGCDAVVNCTHGLASAASAVKEKAGEKGHEVKDEAKEAVKDAVGRAASGAYEKAKEVGSDAGSKIAHKVTRGTKEAGSDMIGTIKTTKDTGKTVGKDVMKNVTTEVVNIKQHVKNGTVSIWDEILSSVQLIALSTAYGIGVWVTFVSSHILTRALSAQQLGIVQSKMYPVYYRSVGYGVSIALVTHMLGKRSRLFEDLGHFVQALNLIAGVVLGMTNLIYFDPRATRKVYQVMLERMKVEEEGMGRDAYLVAEHTRTQEPIMAATAEATPSSSVAGPGGRLTEEEVRESQVPHLRERLKRLNAYTAILNMLTMMSMTWHLAYLGRRFALQR